MAQEPSRSDTSEETPIVQESQDSTSEQSYTRNFFTRYYPQNAYDMVERVPGFSISSDSGARGFGGNAGNVLIDGTRPTSKSGGLEEALKRISASQVVRIDIVRDGSLSREAGGHTTVANVILSDSMRAGSWDLIARLASDGRIEPNVEAAFSDAVNGWEHSSKIDIGVFPGNRDALFTEFDANGLLDAEYDETLEIDTHFRIFSTEVKKEFDLGKLVLNGQYFRVKEGLSFLQNGFLIDSRISSGSASIVGYDRDLDELFRSEEIEFSVDWTQQLDSGWELKILGFTFNEGKRFTSNSFTTETGATINMEESALEVDQQLNEQIVRGTLSKQTSPAWRSEFGIEFALNELDSDLMLFEDDVQQDILGSLANVSELRAEPFVRTNWKPNDRWSFDFGLTAEGSRIAVQGDQQQEQTLKYLKPEFSATYHQNKNRQWQLELKRRIGQLDFEDFASSAEITNDRTTTGNPRLAPERFTTLTLILEQKFGERGSLRSELFHQWRSAVLEQIIFDQGGQGLGNEGDARFYGMENKIDLPLDQLLPGALIEIEFNLRNSERIDPITGINRGLPGVVKHWVGFQFRQDILGSGLSWGLGYRGSFKERFYYADEERIITGIGRWSLFAESNRWFGVKIRVDVEHANTAEFMRRRLLYDGDRSGAFLGSELSARFRNPEFRFEISGQF